MTLQKPALALALGVIYFPLARTPARGAPSQRHLQVPCDIDEGEEHLLGCSRCCRCYRCCLSLEDEIEMDMRDFVQEVHLEAAEFSLAREVSSHESNAVFFCFTQSFLLGYRGLSCSKSSYRRRSLFRRGRRVTLAPLTCRGFSRLWESRSPWVWARSGSPLAGNVKGLVPFPMIIL